MFAIAHDNCFVYSIINIKGLTKPIFKGEQPIEGLMFIWANQTAIPYLDWLHFLRGKGSFKEINIDYNLTDE